MTSLLFCQAFIILPCSIILNYKIFFTCNKLHCTCLGSYENHAQQCMLFHTSKHWFVTSQKDPQISCLAVH